MTRAVVSAIAEQAVLQAAPEEGGLTRNRRGLQWAYDTFEGAFDVAKKSVETAFELIGDALDSYSSVPWSHVIIFVLVVTNIWTIWNNKGNGEARRKKEMLRNEERERWVKEAVTTLWQELAKNGGMSPHPAYVPSEPSHPEQTDGRPGSWKDEVEDISKVLDELQARLNSIRATLEETQAQAQLENKPRGSLSDLD